MKEIPSYRARHVVQGPTIGRVNAGEAFSYEGSTIGWDVEPLNAAAKKQLQKQEEAGNPNGRVSGFSDGVPTVVQPPKSGMMAESGDSGQQRVNTGNVRRRGDPAPSDDAPDAGAPDAPENQQGDEDPL